MEIFVIMAPVTIITTNNDNRNNNNNNDSSSNRSSKQRQQQQQQEQHQRQRQPMTMTRQIMCRRKRNFGVRSLAHSLMCSLSLLFTHTHTHSCLLLRSLVAIFIIFSSHITPRRSVLPSGLNCNYNGILGFSWCAEM